MKSGEKIKSHLHSNMEEFYLFNEGEAVLTIEDEIYKCNPGTFVKIPANASHSIIATEEIRFTYWGVGI